MGASILRFSPKMSESDILTAKIIYGDSYNYGRMGQSEIPGEVYSTNRDIWTGGGI